MDRRDALKTLAGLAGATGMTVTPIVTHDASTDVALLVLKAPGVIHEETARRLQEGLAAALEGTPLAGVKTIVLGDGLDLEVVRARRPPA